MGMAYERVRRLASRKRAALPRPAISPRSLSGPIGALEDDEALILAVAANAVSRPFHGRATEAGRFPGFPDAGDGLVVDLRLDGTVYACGCDAMICPRLRVTPITRTARPPRQGRSGPASWPCHSLLAVPSPTPTKHPRPPWAVVVDPSWPLPSSHRPHQPPPHDSPWAFSPLVFSAWQTPLLSSSSFLC